MAISRFNQPSTSNLTTFMNWLDENKNGTFLDDVTITYDSGTTNAVTFSTESSTLGLTFTTSGGSSQTVVSFTTNDNTWTVTTVSSSVGTAQLAGAILCKNGIMFDFYGKLDASTTRHSYSLAVTVDSNGELAALVTSGTVISTSDFTTWGALAGGSSTFMSRYCYPYYGASRACLAPISAQGNDSTLRIPEAYAAIATPVSGVGLQSVFIDGTPFITNGVWYIRDDDE